MQIIEDDDEEAFIEYATVFSDVYKPDVHKDLSALHIAVRSGQSILVNGIYRLPFIWCMN